MENKFTPGPWYPVQYGPYWNIQDGEYYEDTNVLDEQNFPEMAERNAKIAAASPDLLEALQSCIYLLEEVGIKEATAITQAQAAIKKATL